jgi:hypothetical protein
MRLYMESRVKLIRHGWTMTRCDVAYHVWSRKGKGKRIYLRLYLLSGTVCPL